MNRRQGPKRSNPDHIFPNRSRPCVCPGGVISSWRCLGGFSRSEGFHGFPKMVSLLSHGWGYLYFSNSPEKKGLFSCCCLQHLKRTTLVRTNGIRSISFVAMFIIFTNHFECTLKWQCSRVSSDWDKIIGIGLSLEILLPVAFWIGKWRKNTGFLRSQSWSPFWVWDISATKRIDQLLERKRYGNQPKEDKLKG